MKTQILSTLLMLSTLPAAHAQEPVPPPPAKPEPAPEKEPFHIPPMPGARPIEDDLQKQLAELFATVELRLRAIDTQMYDAAAGRVPIKPVAGSGIEDLLRKGQQAQAPQSIGELLKSASQDSKTTQEEILRILEIARQMNSQSQSQSQGSGQGQSKPQPGGKSPLDGQSGQQPGGREQTPEGPGSKPEGNKPGEGDEPKDGTQPDVPNKPTENRAGKPPPNSAAGARSAADDADRWGDLPVRAREIFRVEGASDLPPQYRDWIDGYYRRLQGLERR
jgi:hypothetical protein